MSGRNKNIDQYPVATSLDGTERLLVNQNGTTKRTTVQKVGLMGARKVTVTSVSAAHTLTLDDEVVRVNATSAPVSITLPNSVTVGPGVYFTLIRTNAGGNAVTLAAVNGQTINGSANKTLDQQWQTLTVISDESGNWTEAPYVVLPILMNFDHGNITSDGNGNLSVVQLATQGQATFLNGYLQCDNFTFGSPALFCTDQTIPLVLSANPTLEGFNPGAAILLHGNGETNPLYGCHEFTQNGATIATFDNTGNLNVYWGAVIGSNDANPIFMNGYTVTGNFWDPGGSGMGVVGQIYSDTALSTPDHSFGSGYVNMLGGQITMDTTYGAAFFGGKHFLRPDGSAWFANDTVTISSSGVIGGNGSGLTNLNASNLATGTVPAGRLPTPTTSTLGGVKAKTAVAHNFVTSIGTDGIPVLAQPAAADISGLAASATTDTTSATNITSGTLAAARGGSGGLSAGILKTNGSGVNSIASAGTDYAVPVYSFSDSGWWMGSNPSSTSYKGQIAVGALGALWVSDQQGGWIPGSFMSPWGSFGCLRSTGLMWDNANDWTFIVNGNTTQANPADNVIALRNEAQTHYSALRFIKCSQDQTANTPYGNNGSGEVGAIGFGNSHSGSETFTGSGVYQGCFTNALYWESYAGSTDIRFVMGTQYGVAFMLDHVTGGNLQGFRRSNSATGFGVKTFEVDRDSGTLTLGTATDYQNTGISFYNGDVNWGIWPRGDGGSNGNQTYYVAFARHTFFTPNSNPLKFAQGYAKTNGNDWGVPAFEFGFSVGATLRCTPLTITNPSTNDAMIQTFDGAAAISLREGGADKNNFYSYGGTLANGKGHRFLTHPGTYDANNAGNVNRSTQTLRFQIADDGVQATGPFIASGNVSIGGSTIATTAMLQFDSKPTSATPEVSFKNGSRIFGFLNDGTNLNIGTTSGGVYSTFASNAANSPVFQIAGGGTVTITNDLRITKSGQAYLGGYGSGNGTTLTIMCAGTNVADFTSSGLYIYTGGLKVSSNGVTVNGLRHGVATLSTNGTATISDATITANTRIFLTPQDNNTTGHVRVSARTAGTGFTITSSSSSDTGVIAYQLIEP